MRIAYVCADSGVPVFGRKGCSVPALRVRLGAAARRKVLQSHSLDAIAGRVFDLARVASLSEARA